MHLSGAEIVVECLKEQGVDTVFGYPGGAILNVYDALYKHQDEITHILTLISTSPKEPERNDSELEIKLKNVTRYLDEHYTESISLDFLAEQFYISKYYLSREFKQEHGTTIIQYLLTKKITHAKELLRYSNSSIEDIAALCGIDDASYFNKVFKKLEGCTASEYRKRW